MTTLHVLNPVATSQGDTQVFPDAPRPTSLEGKTVGLLWNDKRGGDVALHQAGELLQDRFNDLKVNFYKGPRKYPETLLNRAMEECDVFIGSTGD